MHGIMSCNAFSAYSSSSPSDAGHLPLAAPIHTRPLFNAIKIWEGALDVQDFNPAEDTPVATPILTRPLYNAIKIWEGALDVQDFNPAEDTPVATPIPTRPLHIVANNLHHALDVHDANDTPVATSPVQPKSNRDRVTLDDIPLADLISFSKKIRILDGRGTPGILDDCCTLDHIPLAHLVAFAEHIRTLNRPGILDGRKHQEGLCSPPAQLKLKRDHQAHSEFRQFHSLLLFYAYGEDDFTQIW